MRRLTTTLLLVAFTSGCASSTVIRSSPMGAVVKSRSGEVLGRTPYDHSDSATNGHSESFIVEKEGYEPGYVTIKRDQMNGGRTAGGIIGGLMMPPLFLTLLWASDYKDAYFVELKETPVPEEEQQQAQVRTAPRPVPASSTRRAARR